MKLTIDLNLETQVVRMEFDNNEFKSWDTVLGALQAAVREAEFSLEMTRKAGFAKMQMEMAKAADLKRRLQL